MVRALFLLLLLARGAAADLPVGVEQVDRQLATGQQTLATVEERIRERAAARHQTGAERERLQREMHKLDQELAQHREASAQVEQEIDHLSGEVAALEGEVATITASLTAQRALLAERLRQLYAQDGQGGLTWLLGAADAGDLIHRQRYQEVMAAAMGAAIHRFADESRRLAEAQRDLHARQIRLAVDREEAAAARRIVDSKRRERQALLAEVRERSAAIDAQLASLAADRQRLGEMVSGLAAQRQALLSRLRFADQKGRLPWPLAGEVVEFFGPPADGTPAASRNGLRIRATAGDKVRTIWEGEVLFADWFAGYGLLIIVDHGSGYYSLYGHASGLLANVGDHLTKDQVIAEIGSGSGDAGASLYFELRKDGKPIDPLHWLHGLAGRTTTAVAE